MMVSFKTTDIFQEVWRFDPGCPYHQISLNIFAIFSVQAAFISTGDHGLRQHANAKFR